MREQEIAEMFTLPSLLLALGWKRGKSGMGGKRPSHGNGTLPRASAGS